MAEEDDDRLKTVQLLEELDAKVERRCERCGVSLCGHQYVACVVMGFKKTPRCADCLATQLGRDRAELLDHLLEYIQRRACFSAGWSHATTREGLEPGLRPTCLWPASASSQHARAGAAELGHAVSSASVATHARGADSIAVDARWDAGDMGCGDLVLELRGRLRSMLAGQLLEVRARDPGAPQDIPAWCGLTGHHLVSADHPLYWIRRREG